MVNPFEEKRVARVERLRERASRKAREAASLRETNRKIAEVMAGTPVLRGHHSERRHRRELERMSKRDERAFALMSEAEELARRARAVELNTSISSDDPEAIEKLREKLAEHEAERAEMKRLNAVHRKCGWQAVAWDVGVKRATELRERALATADDKPFPAYALTNIGATIRRVKERIEQLENAREAQPFAQRVGDAVIEEAENRVRIRFDGKPDAAMRQALKSAGFRWAPSLGVWQRHASNAARYAAQRVLGGGG